MRKGGIRITGWAAAPPLLHQIDECWAGPESMESPAGSRDAKLQPVQQTQPFPRGEASKNCRKFLGGFERHPAKQDAGPPRFGHRSIWGVRYPAKPETTYLLKTQLFNFLGNMGYMSVKDEHFPRAQGVLRGKETSKDSQQSRGQRSTATTPIDLGFGSNVSWSWPWRFWGRSRAACWRRPGERGCTRLGPPAVPFYPFFPFSGEGEALLK